MERDKKAQITIRDLHKMTKKDVRSLAAWIRSRADKLEEAVANGQLWLVKRQNYAKVFRFGLMK